METEIWQKIDSLFDEYLDASPELQKTFLADRCDDDETRLELKKLISALNQTEDFIENPTFTSVKKILDEEETDNLIGTTIFSYRIEKLLGKGGMGTVYLARRTGDFDKIVAIKIIPPFSNSPNAKEFFRRERQILAKLEHPNIARILDGGTTENGLPFLVMEYVEGVPLNEFCGNLTVSERLKLFQSVCKAVDFAHKNLIIHRDLKPTNIFVKTDGSVKLLDFGIAKLLEKDDFNNPVNLTITGNALTPEYASPEQINGENLTIASDVYSLGVILYEILTNSRPHSFKGKSLNEILQIVSKNEPKSPNISSELDAIVLKSLNKKATKRYHTAEALEEDLSNYLNNLPISARPNTAFYRFEKYISRHKIEAAVSAFVLLLLGGWLATIVWQTSSAKKLAAENKKSAYAAEMILAASEYENTNLNRVNELVQKYSPENGEEDLRGFEWFYLRNLLNPTSKITSFLHQDEIWNAEFSPDDRFLTTVSNDNIIRIWDVEKREITLQFEEQKGAWKCAYFPDGKRLAVSMSAADNAFVKIFDTSTGKEILTLKGHEKRIRAVDVSPDGKTVASGSQDGTVRIWNANNGEELRKLEFSTAANGTEINDVQFSKNGEKLAVIGFDTLSVLDTKTWKQTNVDLTHFADRNVTLFGWKVAFSPLEKTLAIGNFSGEVMFLDADKLSIIRVLRHHQANVKSLSYSPDGKILATSSWDRTIKFVDVQTGEIVNVLKGHFAGVHEIAFSADGKKLATASADFAVNIWDAEQVLKTNSMPTDGGISVFSFNGITSWISGLNEISSWDFDTKQKIWAKSIQIAAISADYSEKTKDFIFGERDGFVSYFESSKDNYLRRVKLSEKTIYAVKFSSDGKSFFTIHEDGMLKAFESDTLKEIYSTKAHETNAKAMSSSPDGKFLATGGSDKIVKILEAETGKELFKFNSHTKPLYLVAFSKDSSLLVSAGADDIARIWRVSDGKLLHELSGMSAGIFAATFSPDGKRLATSSDVGIIRLWDVESGKQVLAFKASQKQVNHLRFADDGNTLISIDINATVSFWQGK